MSKTIKLQGLDSETSLFPIGYIYISTSNVNPSNWFGGTWTKIRQTYGGELLAYAMVGTSEGSKMNAGTSYSFSDLKMGSKTYDVVNYVDGILYGGSGAIQVTTKGIVGFVKATISVSGLGTGGQRGLWFQGNGNPLPTGVTLMSPANRTPLLGGVHDANYGGNTLLYYYKVETTDNLQFWVNPQFNAYGGSGFTPGSGGVGCWLQVECYAKAGVYVWKRTG